MSEKPEVSRLTIGIVAPSSVVPRVEFGLGVERIKRLGFKVVVNRQCLKRHAFFAGSDPERAEAFFEHASSDEIEVVWCARGGYGAFRILPLLERLTKKHGRPRRKLLVGYSDSTCLMEYVRTRWNWKTLHAPMPGLREFSCLPDRDLRRIVSFVSNGSGPDARAAASISAKLKFVVPAVKSVTGEVVGGNLSVWASMVGSAFEGNAKGKILFLEDVSEGLYRLDRMVGQLAASGGFDGVKAIVLGTFHDCTDMIPRVLKSMPKDGKASEFVPLRPKISISKGLREIFGSIGEKFKIPVAIGLSSGHGDGHNPLPLGGKYRISTDGRFELLGWE